ncbi:helix-turn-helix domain-containing protein [Klebsiella oxytoca]|uniref:helix-turn-helix domain-containing protein n=1 Tax=Klebsiella oxytoca TaxID=571 RepID=UPI0007CBA4EF|nr:helix-turn-helix domain-containing protein [Klebsiella oxytoca]SBM11894.1 right origin-binding protein [Klebsiella oxytoca]
MDQAGIIRDLLSWLEGHLDQPLSLDNVAAKAGYSKWHLQRMFKDVTGHAIGAYIRARRLSKSAVALRLTARPILDIALQYRFDSQQTFTRAFKKQFSLTPALYRRSPDWSSYGMRPPLRLGEFTMPQYEFVTLNTTQLVGVTQSYTCKLEEISEEGGEYVMFTYEGLGTGLQEFILTVYGTCMPMLNLTRRKGLDIERFFPEDESRNQEPPIQLRCEYLIPIRR